METDNHIIVKLDRSQNYIPEKTLNTPMKPVTKLYFHGILHMTEFEPLIPRYTSSIQGFGSKV